MVKSCSTPSIGYCLEVDRIMTAPAALPAHVRDDEGAVLTFIVPAERCNLNCPFCFIKLRNETTHEIALTVEDYGRFISDVAARRKIAAICIQGHEPLLPESYAYTDQILSVGRKLGVPTSIVTNGTFLSTRIDDLTRLGPDRIAVSLDSHLAEHHDKQRGKNGAFEATVSGLRAAILVPELHRAISVTSVLLPKKSNQLIGMPELLSSLEIYEWNVNILINFTGRSFVRSAHERDIIIQELKKLNSLSNKHGIRMTVDDEFDSLGDCADRRDIEQSKALRIKRLLNPCGVLRLLPNGQCSVGIEIMQKQNVLSPRWNPAGTNAGKFVDEILDRRTMAPC